MIYIIYICTVNNNNNNITLQYYIVRPRINVIGYFLCFVCFVVVFRLFDCFVFSLDVCCRCTVLFYVCIYVHC